MVHLKVSIIAYLSDRLKVLNRYLRYILTRFCFWDQANGINFIWISLFGIRRK